MAHEVVEPSKEGNTLVVPRIVAVSTAELVAACAATQKQSKFEASLRDAATKHLPGLGAGRAAREARAKQSKARKALERLRAAPGAEKQCELERREQVSMAQEDLNSAIFKQMLEDQMTQESIDMMMVSLTVARIQRFVRSWIARTRAAKRERHRQVLLEQELQRLWTELRRPRHVILPGELRRERASAEMLGANRQSIVWDDVPVTPMPSLKPTKPFKEARRVSVEKMAELTALVKPEQEKQPPPESDDGSSEYSTDMGCEQSDAFTSAITDVISQSRPPRRFEPTTGERDEVKQSQAATKLAKFLEQNVSEEVDTLQQQLEGLQLGKASRNPSREPTAVKQDSPRFCVAPKKASPKRRAMSPKLSFHQSALTSLRSALSDQFCGATEPLEAHSAKQKEDAIESVRRVYLSTCEKWHVKPNSRVLKRLQPGRTHDEDHVYDFTDANVGDRGVFCVLFCLTFDPYCAEVSLKCCGLREPSSHLLASFIELHPRIRQLDLSQNNLSFEAGQTILNALYARSRRGSIDPASVVHEGAATTATVSAALLAYVVPRPLALDLGGTALAWGRGGPTVGPPCGTLWAKDTHKTRLAPSVYEDLRQCLDETKHVQYVGSSPRSRSTSPVYSPPTSPCSGGRRNKKCKTMKLEVFANVTDAGTSLKTS
jgi:hypothetical protein